jgi:hypothetical protein
MNKNRGQSYTEYVVVVFFGILLLLAKDETGTPYVGRLIAVIKQSYQGYATSIALPELPTKITK